MGVVAGWLIIGGAMAFGYQTYFWVIEGFWTPLSMLDLWIQYGGNPPRFELKGLERGVIWLLDLPLALTSFTLGFVIGFFQVRVEVFAVRRQDHARRQLGLER